MADVSKYKQALDKFNRKSSFFKAEVGDNRIRVLPPKDEDDLFFVEAKYHYLPVGGEHGTAKVCPRSIDDMNDCAVCDFITRKLKGHDEESPEGQLEKQIYAKRKMFANIIDRAKPKEGPQKWAIPTTVLPVLLKACADDDFGPIDDPEAGYDIDLNRSGAGRMTRYSAVVRPKSTKLSKDEDEAEEWLEKAEDLAEVIVKDTVDNSELKKYVKQLEAQLTGNTDDTDDDDDDDEPPVRTKKAVKEAPPVKKKKVEPEPEEDDDEDEDDEEDEPAPKKKAAPAKKAKPPVDDDDDDEDEDDEDEDDDLDEIFDKKKKK